MVGAQIILFPEMLKFSNIHVLKGQCFVKENGEPFGNILKYSMLENRIFKIN
jgi:hypothetical protein